MTETGPAPWLAEYGAREIATADYRMRTEANVRDSDATLWFGNTSSPGGRVTLNAIRGMGKPHMIVRAGEGVRPSEVADWITRRGFESLDVAGSRESRAPGIGARVERFLAEVFTQIGA